MKKWEIRPRAVPKIPKPMVTKCGVGDDAGDPTLCKISLGSDSGFLLPARARRARVQSDSAWVSADTVYTAKPLHRLTRSIVIIGHQ